MANDYLRLVCKICKGMTRLYSYYPAAPFDACEDGRAFIEVHIGVCFADRNMGAHSLGTESPIEIHTEGSYFVAYGTIPVKEALLPDGKWREDPPGKEHEGFVAIARRSYRGRDRREPL